MKRSKRSMKGWWIRPSIEKPDLLRQGYIPPTKARQANRAARRREHRENWAAWNVGGMFA